VKDWIPLLQSLVWPAFVGFLLFVCRRQVAKVSSIILDRIEGGATVKIGSVSLGATAVRKLTRLDESPKAVDETADNFPSLYKQTVYLVHHVGGVRVDSDGHERRDIQIVLDGDSQDILDEVEHVIYHLHPSFPNPDRKITDRQSSFKLIARAWGEFNLNADIYFKGYEKPLNLSRYLNFPWPS
jgi:hypothetical protein